MTNQNTTAEHWRLQLIAAACALQHATATAANIIPIPGGDRLITIGTALDVARLLEIAPAGGNIDVLDTLDAITGKDIAGIACFETERFYLAGDVDGLVIRAARQIGQQAEQLVDTGKETPAPMLTTDELGALRRFDECAQDGEGYDVPKEMMQRLAEIGVVQRRSGAYYQATVFGQRVLEGGAA